MYIYTDRLLCFVHVGGCGLRGRGAVRELVEVAWRLRAVRNGHRNVGQRTWAVASDHREDPGLWGTAAQPSKPKVALGALGGRPPGRPPPITRCPLCLRLQGVLGLGRVALLRAGKAVGTPTPPVLFGGLVSARMLGSGGWGRGFPWGWTAGPRVGGEREQLQGQALRPPPPTCPRG